MADYTRSIDVIDLAMKLWETITDLKRANEYDRVEITYIIYKQEQLVKRLKQILHREAAVATAEAFFDEAPPVVIRAAALARLPPSVIIAMLDAVDAAAAAFPAAMRSTAITKSIARSAAERSAMRSAAVDAMRSAASSASSSAPRAAAFPAAASSSAAAAAFPAARSAAASSAEIGRASCRERVFVGV